MIATKTIEVASVITEGALARWQLVYQIFLPAIDTLVTRVAEVAREHGWHPPKSLDTDEIFKPEYTLFCCELRFVAIYALFLEILGIKSAFLGKNSASWARSALLHGVYCILCLS